MVKFITKTVCIALVTMLCMENVSAQAKTSSKTFFDVPTVNSSEQSICKYSRAAWDILYDYTYTSIATGFYAPFYYDGKIYAARWNSTATGNAMGKIYRFNISGTTLTPDGDVTVSGITGSYNFEDFCTDGTHFYSANESGKIFKIDPTNWTLVSTINVPISDVAPIAYDKASGGFWIASMFGESVTLVTSTGSSTGTTLTGASSGIMGLAYDDVSAGGPYVLAACGSSSTGNVAAIGRWKVGENNAFNTIHNVSQDFPLTGTGHSMGAIFEYEADGKFNIVALSQGQTKIIGYEVAESDIPCPEVTDVTATPYEGSKVEIEWVAPTTTPDSYKIYDGDTEIGTTTTETSFITESLASGSYTFGVEAIYSNDCTPVKVTVTYEHKTCDPAVDLTAVHDDTGNQLNWVLPNGNTINIYRDGSVIASNVEGTTYHDDYDPTLAACYKVEVNCSEGGHSEMSNEACVDPCNNVTALTVEFSETEVCAATLKWTAPAYMTDPKYNIYRDGTSIATDVSKIEYIDDKDLEQSKEYTWVVKTVCTDSESTGTEAKGSCPVGINELENNVSIYPNPATTLVTINGKDITKVEVYNMVGLLIETKTGIVTSIDVSSYNTGIYFFKVYDSNNNSVTKRVMIAK